MEITPFLRLQSLQILVEKGQCVAVSETMESTRRWSGYVCPDCRFVFRVPRDHDGKGIVCPSCRRMLKIPTSDDTPPPLIVPLRKIENEPSTVEEVVREDGTRMVKKRRRGKRAPSGDDHTWESNKSSRSSSPDDGGQTRLLLFGGALILAALVGGGLLLLKGQKSPEQPQPPIAQITPTETPQPVEEVAPVMDERILLEEGTKLARVFLEADTVDKLLPLVKDPEVARPRMLEFYGGNSVTPVGFSSVNDDQGLARNGKVSGLDLNTGDFERKVLGLIETDSGLKVDWESWVGWSEMPWEQFLSEKPTEPKLFRVELRGVDYYNFAFTDEKKWQSVRLLSPDGEHAIYGYAEVGSLLAERLRFDKDVKSRLVMLKLKFPPDAESASQVVISEFVAEGWVEGVEEQ